MLFSFVYVAFRWHDSENSRTTFNLVTSLKEYTKLSDDTTIIYFSFTYLTIIFMSY